MTETESRPRNRALVASFLFTDIVGYSKGTASEQYAAKAALSEILGRNLAALSKDDYRIKDTGDGALIAFLVNPEHALYMALAIAHDFANAANVSGLPPSRVRTGLHIGAVKEAIDLESRPNFVGDGINAAQRVMDLAAPGQVTASRAYFEAVSWLDSSYAALFRHLGESNDKHGRAHDLYAVTPSDTVLERLRLELGGPVQETREGAKAAAAPPEKPAERSKKGSDAPAAASAKPGGERRWLVPAAAIAGLAIVAAIALVAVPQNRGAPVSGSAETRTGAAESKPAPDAKLSVPSAQPASDAKASTSSPQPADAKGATAALSPAEPATLPASKTDAANATRGSSDANPPAPTAAKAPAPARSNAASAGTDMQRTGGPSAPAPVAASAVSPGSRPAPPTSAAAPPSGATASPGGSGPASGASAPPGVSGPASARCRHILEKVQIGEPLSQDEKKELASSCR